MNLLKISCILLGENYGQVSRQTPETKRVMANRAVALAIPVMIWFVLGLAFTRVFFHKPVSFAILAGLFSASLVWLVDRSILMARKNGRSSLLRVGLAVAVAIIGAICLDELLFAEDIRNYKLERLDTAYNKEMPDDLLAAQASVAYLDSLLQAKRKEAVAEAQGKGSGNVGVGKITLFIDDQVKDLGQELTLAQERLEEIERKREETYVHAREGILAGKQDHAMIDNLEIMWILVTSNTAMKIVYSVLSLLFLMLELLPLSIKLSQPETSYESMLRLNDELATQKYRAIRDRQAQYYDPVEADPAYQTLRQAIRENNLN